MSLLSALIQKRDTRKAATAISAIPATQPRKEAGTVARIATVAVANPKEGQTETPAIVGAGDTATASVWWLVHYMDGAPVEVWTSPPATHAEILERHPEAIAAEPFNQAEPARACSTCSRATYRGGCGEPVAAGLSDLPGVIRYSPDQGATCPAWLAVLDGDLEARIRAMAERWHYSAADLCTALDGARQDAAGWLLVLEIDETERGD